MYHVLRTCILRKLMLKKFNQSVNHYLWGGPEFHSGMFVCTHHFYCCRYFLCNMKEKLIQSESVFFMCWLFSWILSIRKWRDVTLKAEGQVSILCSGLSRNFLWSKCKSVKKIFPLEATWAFMMLGCSIIDFGCTHYVFAAKIYGLVYQISPLDHQSPVNMKPVLKGIGQSKGSARLFKCNAGCLRKPLYL